MLWMICFHKYISNQNTFKLLSLKRKGPLVQFHLTFKLSLKMYGLLVLSIFSYWWFINFWMFYFNPFSNWWISSSNPVFFYCQIVEFENIRTPNLSCLFSSNFQIDRGVVFKRIHFKVGWNWTRQTGGPHISRSTMWK